MIGKTMTHSDKPSAQLAFLAAEILENRQEDIVGEYKGRLREARSPLLDDVETERQLTTQAKAMLKDAARTLRGQDPSVAQAEDELSTAIGASRAYDEVHPHESLRAMGKLFEAAVSVTLSELPTGISHVEVARISASVQQGMLERIMRAAVAYNEYLLHEIHESNTDERYRISRELHDRVGSSLVIISQNLELYKDLNDGGVSRAEEKIDLAREAARDALWSAREISVDLRRSMVQNGLEVELTDLLARLVPTNVQASVSVRGDESIVPPYVRDELFLVLREAVRNAYEHAKAQNIRVEISTDPDMVWAAVSDDGQGFDPRNPDTVAGAGLESMKERASLLGGRFRVLSSPEGGTRVEAFVPLARRR